jgi:hypothetical protein
MALRHDGPQGIGGPTRRLTRFNLLLARACFTRLICRMPIESSICTAMVLALTATSSVSQTSNSDTRIVLHAEPYELGHDCSTPQQVLGLNCASVRPTVTVNAGQAIEVYVYLHSYNSVAGVQLALSRDSSWTTLYWSGGCQANEVLAVPAPHQSGDSYIGAFDAITGGILRPIGRLRMIAGSATTQLSITETWAPGGTGVVDGTATFTPIPFANRGRIGVGMGGHDACSGTSESSALFTGQ